MLPTGSSRKSFEPEMVFVPAGTFLMGSLTGDRWRSDDEPDQCRLNLDYFYAIGKYPVTVRQYCAFVDAGGYQEQRFWTGAGWQQSNNRTQPDHWKDPQWAGDDNLPVVGVSWYEASAYALWLAEATGRDYRLPTEAEWEKTARGGLELPDGRGGLQTNPYPARIWPWGDEQPDDKRLNFNNSLRHTTPVGTYPTGASPYGALDMAGNVWEWCLSRWANPYAHPENNDPVGESDRVVRGGSWYNADYQARCSYRLRLHANLRFDHDVSFRLRCSTF
jgi:formylglycine-generating enzyme required for sulfatase activity